MILLPPFVQAVMSSGHTVAFHTMRIYNAAGDTLLASTTYFRDITAGGVLYTADGKIKSLAPSVTESTLDRSQYSIVLTEEVPAPLALQLQGKLVLVQMGLEYLSVPYLDELFVVYSGRVDGIQFSANPENKERLVTLQCSSPMFDLDAKGGRYISDSSMLEYDPTDTAAVGVFEGSAALVLKWGRK